jgi:hypothetical protein
MEPQPPPKKLLVCDTLRLKHHSIRTEQSQPRLLTFYSYMSPRASAKGPNF